VLGILGRLRARVGTAGRVVGADRDAAILDVARQIDAQQGNGVDFVLGDATSLDLPSDSFDFVHVRTVLLNVTEPERVIAEMVRIARPGGTVAIQEPDSASWLCDPLHPAFEELRTELVDAFRRNGMTFDTGRLISRMLRDAGLLAIKVKATARVTSPGDYYQTFLLTLTALVRDQIVAGARLTAAEFDAKSAALRKHLSQPGTLTCQPMMWQSWATKP
jgi:ubiquinone/menaquinone biosynthesis C-methylase UbiE